MTKLGSEMEFAIWYDANEYLDPINSCRESMEDAIDAICVKNNIGHGKISYEILKPGDDRVPSVPSWLENTNGALPKLFVATTKTKIMSSAHQEPDKGIIEDLDKKDIVRLRIITQREYHKVYPNDTPLTNHECDQIIDKLGMQIVMDQLRSSVVN